MGLIFFSIILQQYEIYLSKENFKKIVSSFMLLCIAFCVSCLGYLFINQIAWHEFYNQNILNGEATIRTPTPTIKKCAEVAVTETYILRYGVRNELATKAFKMSGGDMDFLKTVEVESNWDPKALGDDGLAKGLCQWRIEWQKAILNDPNFKDPDWQLQKCFDFYSWYKEQWILGSRLYGFRARHTKDHVFQVKTYQNIISMYKCD